MHVQPRSPGTTNYSNDASSSDSGLARVMGLSETGAQRGFHDALTLSEESAFRTSLALLRVGPSHLEIGLDVDDRAGISRYRGRMTHPLPSRARVGCCPSLKEKTVCQEVWPSVYSAVGLA